MNRSSRIGLVGLCAAVSLLAGTASALGILLRGDGSWLVVTSVRGETYRMVTSGVYEWNAQRVVAEGIGWDLVTLLVAVPALLATLPWLARGSFRARLFAGGVLGYLFYQYVEYSMTWAFGPLLPLFVVIYATSLGGLLWVAATFRMEPYTGGFDDRFPARGWAFLSTAMAAGLAILWLQRIALALTVGIDGLLMGETTMTVQALDLGLVVPTALLTTVFALRRSTLGLSVTAGYVVSFGLMSAAITAMLLSAWVVEGTLEVTPVVIFGLATLAAFVLGVRIYRSALPDAAVLAPSPERLASLSDTRAPTPDPAPAAR